MKQFFTGAAGVALLVAGIAGLIFCIVGLALVARAEGNVEAALMEQLELADRALAATAEALAMADTTLDQASAVAATLESAVSGLAGVMQGTIPTLDAVGVLLGDQLPATIRSTQETLSSLAESAKLVDDALGLVTSIPLLGIQRYQPEVPLARGVAGVAAALERIPSSLDAAEQGLASASGSLVQLRSDTLTIADTVGEITSSVESAKSVVAEYRIVVADLQGLVAWARDGLPTWLRLARVGISLILVWLGVAQLGLITQGWELIGRSRARSAPEAPFTDSQLP